MKTVFLKKLFLMAMALMLFLPGFAMAADCIATPKSLSMNYTGMPKAGVPIDFTLDAVSSCSGSLYYFFTYIPDYGTSLYDGNNNWKNMMTDTQAVSFTAGNTVRYTFRNAGYYVVVADVSPTAGFATPVRNIIGTSVTVQENSGGTDVCPFQATALNVTVTNALNGQVVPGATVRALTQTATSSDNGTAALMSLPTSQDVVVTVSAPNFVEQTMAVRLACGEVQSQGIALLPSGDTGVAEGDIRVILTWGQNPEDIDSHMTGPVISSSERFHVYYSNPNNNGYNQAYDTSIPCWLDVDDVDSYGPETTTINKINGSFTAGTYRYYVHHYSGSTNIPASGAVVQVYKGGQLVRSFSAPTTNDPNVGDNYVWSVFEMNLAADGSYTINPVNTYSSTGYSSGDTTIFRNGVKLPSFIPEVYHLFMSLPSK